jgi:hypothetical protein
VRITGGARIERLVGADCLDTGFGYWFQNLSTHKGMRRQDELAEKSKERSAGVLCAGRLMVSRAAGGLIYEMNYIDRRAGGG